MCLHELTGHKSVRGWHNFLFKLLYLCPYVVLKEAWFNKGKKNMAQLKYHFQTHLNKSWASITLSDCQVGACRHFGAWLFFLINEQTC